MNDPSKSGWVVGEKSRMVAWIVGGLGRGASQRPHSPPRHVSLPEPHTLIQGRFTSGTMQACQLPPSQVSSPVPQTSEQARVTLGTSQALHTPSSHVSTPAPQSSAQLRVAPAVAHGAGVKSELREPQLATTNASRAQIPLLTTTLPGTGGLLLHLPA
jgi:hypothetical protein